MKRIITLSIALLLTGVSVSAQTIETEQLFQKYKGKEGVVSIWIPGIAMKLAASIADLDSEETAFLRSVKSVRVLTIENSHLYPGVNFTREANLQPGKNGYQLMVQVSDGGQDVMILGKEKNGKLKNLLILVGGDDNVMVHLKGRMNADMAGSIARIAGLEGTKYLSHL
ncbi:MAG: DUF4252 domain-containing protein [Bacteroidales bacterium]